MINAGGNVPGDDTTIDSTSIDRTAEFRRLHDSGCFVMPNPWDLGSARLLAGLGFSALASTSSGFAWTLARRDNHITLDECLRWLRALSAGVELPVNADFEDGFAAEPEDVATNVALAARTGIAGLSIEDSTRTGPLPLYERAVAVDRVRAARRAIDESGRAVVLTGRAEGFVSGRPDLDDTIRRLVAYAEAGADCLFAPGLRSLPDIAAIVLAVAPKPVNVLVSSDFTTVRQLADIGVRRISVGGALARVAWGGVLAAAREIASQGTFTLLSNAAPSAIVQGWFDVPGERA
jgi:2-methylisocitrate lyase-like PEP mutase family enzyme